MERFKGGVEALNNRPFRNVVLGFEPAFELLTEKTRKVISENASEFLSELDLTVPRYQEGAVLLKEIQQFPEDYSVPGGLSLTENGLKFIYENLGNFSFRNVLKAVMTDFFPQVLKDDSERNPGTACVGYLLDLFEILDPKIASFKDGVSSMIDIMRNESTEVDFIILGAMIDDAMDHRGNEADHPDIFSDKERSIKLKDVTLELTTEKERKQFQKGLDITYDELFLGINKISLE